MKKKWFVIDVHKQYIPRDATRLASAADGTDYAASLKRIPSAYDANYDMADRLRIMDEAGEDKAVLEQSAWSPQGLEIQVSTGRVILRIVKEDTEIKAGELLSLPQGKALSEAKKRRHDGLTRPPTWVESMINDMARDRLREFFPSAVPIDSDKQRKGEK